MILVIAEKPALGMMIAEAIGIVKRDDGFVKCKDDHIVTWAVGHILEICPPEAFNEAYKKWDLKDLPLKVTPIKKQPCSATKKQFNIVKKLLAKAKTVINAGDCDDEGELIVREILDYCNFSGKHLRLIINDLNLASIQKALSNMQPSQKFDGLYKKALARSIADYVHGINLTRAMTLFARKRGATEPYHIGRVQTPILGMVCERFLQNKNHKAGVFYQVKGNFNFSNKSLEMALAIVEKIPTNEKKQIIDENVAKEITAKKGTAVIIGKSQKTKEITPPLPFSLLDLQVEANKRFKYKANETLKITQALREKYKCISYNRSDCKYLSNDQYQECLPLLEELIKNFDASINVDKTKKSKAFNDGKITAHTAIIPTKVADVGKMSEKEKNIYLLITERLLMQFMDNKKVETIQIDVSLDDVIFVKKEERILEQGWDLKNIKKNPDFDDMEKLTEQEKTKDFKIFYEKKKDKPPALYTEATLLKDLRNVAKYIKTPKLKKAMIAKDKDKDGENGGIGTPATRSAILEKLKTYYLQEQGKNIIPTDKGMAYYKALPDSVLGVELTAIWSIEQEKIEKGELSVEDFLKQVNKDVANVIDTGTIDLEFQGIHCDICDGLMVKKRTFFGCTNYPDCKNTAGILNGEIAPDCPICGKKLRINEKAIGCSNEKCSFVIFKSIAKRKLKETEILELIKRKETKTLKGFVSKKGSKFDAKLVIKDDGKVGFSFN